MWSHCVQDYSFSPHEADHAPVTALEIEGGVINMVTFTAYFDLLIILVMSYGTGPKSGPLRLIS